LLQGFVGFFFGGEREGELEGDGSVFVADKDQ